MPWPKGQSGNPGGRPPKGIVYDLEKAIKKVEKSKGKTLLAHFAERAFEDDTVLIAVMKKRLPDLKQVEGSLGLGVVAIPLLPEERALYQELADKLAKQITQGGNDETIE